MKTLILAALLCVLLALDTAQGQCGYTPACPSGWTAYKDRCFTFVPTAMTWADAEKNCQSLGGNLASVRGAEEYGVILKMIGDGTSVWLGGTDAQKEGNWIWTDGTPFTYTNWPSGQPDNWQGNENCLHITVNAKQWNDLGCQNTLPSVCSKNL